MRISDDRYSRDLQRMDLALRLIGHEARTFTIRQWTGLSDDRIRKLYRNYVADGHNGAVARHRGKSPRRVAFFFRSPELHFQATQLAGLYVMHGLLEASADGVEAGYRLGSLDSGALLVAAYEAYLTLHTPARISFEHAWFLLLALGRRAEIRLQRCPACGALQLCDPYARNLDACDGCRQSSGLSRTATDR